MGTSRQGTRADSRGMGSTSGNHVLTLCASLLVATVSLGQSEPVGPTGEDGEKEPPKVDQTKGGFTGEMPFRLHDLPKPSKHGVDNQVVQVQLKAVEQAVGDMGPLEKSLRNVSQGLNCQWGSLRFMRRRATSAIPQIRTTNLLGASCALMADWSRSMIGPTTFRRSGD